MARKIRFIFKNDEKAEDMAVSRNVSRPLVVNTMKEAVDLLRRLLRRDIPVMLLGASGFGKSQLLFQAGTTIPNFPVKKENIIDIRAGNMNVEDLRGLPFVEEAPGEEYEEFKTMITKTSVPDWLKQIILHPKENFILFFDELNHASEHVLNAAYAIILDRQFDDYKFGNRVRVVAAGNKPDQNESVAEISEPLQDRLQIIDIDIATENDKDFYHSYLRDKYKDVIPKEWLDIVFDDRTVTSTPRTIERQLIAWAADIEEGEPILTRTGALEDGDYARIQDLYSQQIAASSGSQDHLEIIDRVEAYIVELKRTDETFFTTEGGSISWKALVDGEKEVSKNGVFETISPEGIAKIYEKFSNVPEEMVEAAIDTYKAKR